MSSKNRTLPKWTKPGFMGKIFGKPDQFSLSRKAESNIPISLNIGDTKIKWEDTMWVNGRITEPVRTANPTLKEIREMKIQNSKLQIECEILLNMLTAAELKKSKLQKELSEKQNIMLDLVQKVESQQQET